MALKNWLRPRTSCLHGIVAILHRSRRVVSKLTRLRSPSHPHSLLVAPRDFQVVQPAVLDSSRLVSCPNAISGPFSLPNNLALLSSVFALARESEPRSPSFVVSRLTSVDFVLSALEQILSFTSWLLFQSTPLGQPRRSLRLPEPAASCVFSRQVGSSGDPAPIILWVTHTACVRLLCPSHLQIRRSKTPVKKVGCDE